MKKKILFSLLLLVLIIPCCLLAGCKKDEKKLIINPAADIGNYGYMVESGSAYVTPEGYIQGGMYLSSTVKKGSSASFDVILFDNYNVDTLKVYANGNEISWSKNASYDAERIALHTCQIVATFTLNNVQEDTNISITCEEKNIKFTFKLKDDYVGTEEQQGYAKDFYIGDTCLYDAIVNGSYVYSMKYSEFLSKGLPINSKKQVGYYKLKITDEQSQIASFLSSLNGVAANYFEYLDGKFTESKKDYELEEMYDNPFKASNEIEIDLNGICKNTDLVVIKNIGRFVSIKLDGTVDYDSLDPKSFTSEQYRYAIISFDDGYGLDYSQAKLYINGTELVRQGDGTYRLALTKMPIAYLTGAGLADGDSYHTSDYNAYTITVTGVNLSTMHGLTKIKVSTDNKNIDIAGFGWSEPYYVDIEEGIFLVGDNSDESSTHEGYLDLQNIGTVPNTIIITVDGVTVTLRDQDILSKITAERHYVEIEGCSVVKISGDYKKDFSTGEELEHTLENIQSIWFEIATGEVHNIEIRLERQG